MAGPGRLLIAIAIAIAIAFSTFQLYTAAYSPLPSQIVRAVHVGFLLLLALGFFANRAKPRASPSGGTGLSEGWLSRSGFTIGSSMRI